MRHTFKAVYYCAFALALSMVSWNAPTVAQSLKLDSLIDQIGKQGRGSSKSDRSSDSRGNRDRDGNDRSDEDDLDRLEDTLELTREERLIVRRLCAGEIDVDDTSLIGLEEKFSRLEMDYCQRVQGEILQFGYNHFRSLVDEESSGNGSIQDQYILGEGDELLISFYGRDSGRDTVTIDREGRVIIRDFPPVTVAGMTFGEFRRWLKASVKEKILGTEVYLSLGAIKSVAVTVSGEVIKPGRQRLTALSSILDAISTAEGIKKTGSLRRIQVFRGSQIFWVDLYDILLTSGFSQDLTLRDGDHVVVPLIGQTFAVAGYVNRPGIYELPEGDAGLSVDMAMKMAGGGLRPRGIFVRHSTFDDQGREVTVERAARSGKIRGGDVITVVRSQDIQLGTVELLGHVRNSGKRSLASAGTVKDLVRSEKNIKDNPYLPFAVLETTDPTTRARRNFPINLRKVLSNQENFALRDGDRLIVLSARDVSFLNSHDVQELLRLNSLSESGRIRSKDVRQPEKAATGSTDREKKKRLVASNNQLTRDIVQSLLDRKLITLSEEQVLQLETELSRDSRNSCRGLQHLAAIVKVAGNNRYRNALQASAANSEDGLENLQSCPKIFDTKPNLLPYVLEHVVAVNGEVRKPGAYPVANNANLSSLIAVAGGLTREVSLSQLEISRFQSGANVREVIDLSKQPVNSVQINPGDVAHFNAVYADREIGPVRLFGEFVRPGLYDIRRGEKLSEVISRAGGLTKQAYPYGSIFTRESVKSAQKIAFQRTARELKSSAIFAGGSRAATPQSLAALKDLTHQIENIEPLGRIVMESDPTVLQVRPEFDTVLEAGDQIFVPKRPNSVLVIGDVLNPGALQFVAGSKVDQYVNQAGGLQQSADEDRMFLVFPNGVAQPVSVSVWNYNPIQVPPGSTIVVPKDPVPLDLFTFAKEITALVSQMAITAASLAVIGNN